MPKRKKVEKVSKTQEKDSVEQKPRLTDESDKAREKALELLKNKGYTAEYKDGVLITYVNTDDWKKIESTHQTIKEIIAKAGYKKSFGTTYRAIR